MIFVAVTMFLPSCQNIEKGKTTEEFPFYIPAEKPTRPLSATVARNYDVYPAIRPEQNELYSQFKYTELKGYYYSYSPEFNYSHGLTSEQKERINKQTKKLKKIEICHNFVICSFFPLPY